MEIVIVSKHPAVTEYIIRELSPICPFCDELEWETPGCRLARHQRPKVIASAKGEDVVGKVVIGDVPLSLAARAKLFIAIEYEGSPPKGTDYSIEDMEAEGVYLVAYSIKEVDVPSGDVLAALIRKS